MGSERQRSSTSTSARPAPAKSARTRLCPVCHFASSTSSTPSTRVTAYLYSYVSSARISTSTAQYRVPVSSSSSSDIGDASERSQSHHVPATTTRYPGSTSGTPKRTASPARRARSKRRRRPTLRRRRAIAARRSAMSRSVDVAFLRRSRQTRLASESRLGVRQRARISSTRRSRSARARRSSSSATRSDEAVSAAAEAAEASFSSRAATVSASDDARAVSRASLASKSTRASLSASAFASPPRGEAERLEIHQRRFELLGGLFVACGDGIRERRRARRRAPVSPPSRPRLALGERASGARRSTSRSISADLSSLAAFSSPSSAFSARVSAAAEAAEASSRRRRYRGSDDARASRAQSRLQVDPALCERFRLSLREGEAAQIHQRRFELLAA